MLALKDCIDYALIVNGVYDISCSVCILVFLSTKSLKLPATLHSSMFRDEEQRSHALFQRMLSYWILTYGITRLMAGLSNHKTQYYMASATYFVEAGCLSNELIVHKSIIGSKGVFVITICLCIGSVILLFSAHTETQFTS